MIQRYHKNPRMSQMVVHGNTIYLAGQVANDPSGDVKAQTQAVLNQIDALLAEAGSEKAKILSAHILLSDIGNFAQMNEVWQAWVDTENPPARATFEAALVTPDYLIEIVVIAAL
jgi:enamine deaminase RidA (YjgF/YER057c/UK114 family)